MNDKSKTYYVYILSNKKDGVLYTGVTNNIVRRILEHRLKLKTGFAESYFLSHLVYFEQYEYVGAAIEREKQLKKWERKWKVGLIEKENPEWKDLLCDIATEEQIKETKEIILENKESFSE
ncbi:MAG: GIY-YIG nuclease family protein [Ignavibacteria bacterium]|nr:GIY-YIG nuclease family protein [Ignavibacteria bacterium]